MDLTGFRNYPTGVTPETALGEKDPMEADLWVGRSVDGFWLKNRNCTYWLFPVPGNSHKYDTTPLIPTFLVEPVDLL